MKIAVYRSVDWTEDPGRQFVAVIERGKHLASFTFGASYSDAHRKAEDFLEVEAEKASKRSAPKTKPTTPTPEVEEIEEAI